MQKLTLIGTLVASSIFSADLFAKENSDVALAKTMIESLQRGNKVDGWPHIGPLDYWNFGIDTFTNEVSSEVVADLYSTASKKLVALYKGEVKTYYWSDRMGWPRIATVVQLKIGDKPKSCLVIRAYQNNDNDSFYFSYEKGVFDTKGKKLMPTWKLPKGHLRSKK